jgi:hypothetical protein
MSDFEKPQNNNREGKDEAFFTRHSKSTYKTYEEILSSDDPTKQFDPENQSTPDLPESGIQLANQEAEKFFSNLDKDKDVLFFVSSNEARAIETANIYRQKGKEKGFEAIKPEHSRSGLSDEISGGEIRVIETLSIYPDDKTNALIDSVFNPPAKRGNINWDVVDPDLKRRFDEASKIIEANDKGSFGSNMAAHGEEVKKILPEVHTAEELFKTRFQNIIRLIKFGLKKSGESGLDKNIKILGFGHENYMMYALQKYFEEEGIGNCETIQFEVNDSNVESTFKTKSAQIN